MNSLEEHCNKSITLKAQMCSRDRIAVFEIPKPYFKSNDLYGRIPIEQ